MNDLSKASAAALPALDLDDHALHFVALGGAGEIGMNLSLYGYGGRWLMVDLGISFADETMPGLDVIMADPRFIVERKDQLAGLVLTHAHEDHLGAVQYLWPQLECPIYCTPFTAAVLRGKLAERGLTNKVPIVEVPVRGSANIGPFSVEFVGITHSIPEPHALAIRTPAGTIVHTGDWKLDPQPLIGLPADEARLRTIGDEGVMALVCDSTNAMVPGTSGSEATVLAGLTELFGKFDTRIAVSCFATNVVRLQSIAAAAAANDRNVALVGRSLWRINEAARATGYLQDTPPFLTEFDAGFVPRDKLVLICTGSQGEPRSALARIAAGDHPQISLDPGDVVVFSSREIPGNEKAIGKVQNRLTARGIQLVTADDAPVHVSGHPARGELERMYQWLRPSLSVAVHGEQRHQLAHAKLAEECQVSERLMPVNGEVLRLGPGEAGIVAHVPVGRLGMDGKRLISLDNGTIRERQKLVFNGAAVVTVALNERGELIAAPQASTIGLVEGEAWHDLNLDIVDSVREAVAALSHASRRDDELVRQAVRVAARRTVNASYGKKPVTDVHLLRV